LFYRLNVIPIRVPPLRERVSDIPLLLQHFLQVFSRTKKKPLKRISPAAQDLLMQHPWPGNVRELENLVERLIILTEGEVIEVSDLPERFQRLSLPSQEEAEGFPAQGIHFTDAVQAFERTLLEKIKKQNIPANPDLTPLPEVFPKSSAS
jgi:DNA-binding NtrC family response regulator